MKPLQWSEMKSGVWNGKVESLTCFTVAWHTRDQRWFVASKLPGRRLAYPVGSVAEGKTVAERLWQEFGKVVQPRT